MIFFHGDVFLWGGQSGHEKGEVSPLHQAINPKNEALTSFWGSGWSFCYPFVLRLVPLAVLPPVSHSLSVSSATWSGPRLLRSHRRGPAPLAGAAATLCSPPWQRQWRWPTRMAWRWWGSWWSGGCQVRYHCRPHSFARVSPWCLFFFDRHFLRFVAICPASCGHFVQSVQSQASFQAQGRGGATRYTMKPWMVSFRTCLYSNEIIYYI